MNQIRYEKRVFLTALVCMLPGCFFTEKKDILSADSPALYVVNVLSQQLYNDAHIKGSIQKDLDALTDGAHSPLYTWNKDTPIVFYCSNYQCTASSYAAKLFKKAGFKNVYAYEGGMAEWYQLSKNDSSYMLEGPAQETYLTQVITQPEHEDSAIEIISSVALKEKMISAGLL